MGKEEVSRGKTGGPRGRAACTGMRYRGSGVMSERTTSKRPMVWKVCCRGWGGLREALLVVEIAVFDSSARALVRALV